MADLLIQYLVDDRIGALLTALAVGAIFAVVKHSERLRPARKTSDG